MAHIIEEEDTAARFVQGFSFLTPPFVCLSASVCLVVLRSSRMIEIQSVMARRALELLSLREGEPSHILDIGCGSGLSGEVLSEAGYSWTGVDIAPAMLGQLQPAATTPLRCCAPLRLRAIIRVRSQMHSSHLASSCARSVVLVCRCGCEA